MLSLSFKIQTCEFDLGNPLVVELFSPRVSSFLLVCLNLNPEILVWLSTCLGHIDCRFSGIQGAQQSDGRYKYIARQKCGLHSLLAMVLLTVVTVREIV